MARTMLVLAFAMGGPGCGGDELGECDLEAAQEVVYSHSGMVATKGQAITHDSCGSGVFCHSANARGDKRFGAPAQLDFDTLPEPVGWAVLMHQREAVWSAVADESMPPKGVGASTLGDDDWTFDPERHDDAERLPRISSDEGKAVLRNWLVCDAPVVTSSKLPAWAIPPSDAGAVGTDWSDVFTQIIQPSCSRAGCHNTSTAGRLVLVDECDAYTQLLATGTCEGKPRVIKGDGGSYLLEKLESATPSCGGPMPPAGPLPDAQVAAVRAWVEAGAPSENCE